MSRRSEKAELSKTRRRRNGMLQSTKQRRTRRVQKPLCTRVSNARTRTDRCRLAVTDVSPPSAGGVSSLSNSAVVAIGFGLQAPSCPRRSVDRGGRHSGLFEDLAHDPVLERI